MPGRWDFTLYEGSTFTRVLTWKDANKAAIPLTSYTAIMKIRDFNDPTIILARSDGTSPTITLTLGGVAGTITVVITSTVIAVLNFDIAKHDLEVTLAGATTWLLEGTVTLEKR